MKQSKLKHTPGPQHSKWNLFLHHIKSTKHTFQCHNKNNKSFCIIKRAKHHCITTKQVRIAIRDLADWKANALQMWQCNAQTFFLYLLNKLTNRQPCNLSSTELKCAKMTRICYTKFPYEIIVQNCVENFVIVTMEGTVLSLMLHLFWMPCHYIKSPNTQCGTGKGTKYPSLWEKNAWLSKYFLNEGSVWGPM